MNGVAYIYGLYDPRNGELRYVGKTIDLKLRLWVHMSKAKSNEPDLKSKWIRKLLAENLEPEIRILETSNDSNWPEAERRWIAQCLADDASLFNVSEGGDNPPDHSGEKQSIDHVQKRVEARRKNGSYSHSAETKQKISESKRGRNTGKGNSFFGRKHSEASKQKMSESKKGREAWNKGIPCSDEAKRKISGAKKGTHLSEETRRKMSAIRRGRKLSPEHAENIRQANIGKKLSNATKQKLRVANLGKKHTEETKSKLREIFTGREVSEETRQRLSEANSGKQRTAGQKQHQSEALKARWQDPEYREKMLNAQRKRRARERQEKEISDV